MTFTEKLQHAVSSAQSTLCVGLDPNLEFIPAPVKNQFQTPEEQIAFFCKMVIDYTQEHAAAFKINVAFFEALGALGFVVLHDVIDHIPNDKIVIVDAKRGDISSTADQYKKAFFGELDADAITINPLMGFETLDAYLEDASKGIYVLTLTSNPGSSDFLKRPFEGFDTMGQFIAHALEERSFTSPAHLGMVIGATAEPNEAIKVIQNHTNGSLLIPGVGAQGGSVEDLTIALENHKGIPLINSSRGIIFAGGNEYDWLIHVEKKAKSTKEALYQITEMYA